MSKYIYFFILQTKHPQKPQNNFIEMLSTMNFQQQSGTETPRGALKVSDLEQTINIDKVRENSSALSVIYIQKSVVLESLTKYFVV